MRKKEAEEKIFRDPRLPLAEAYRQPVKGESIVVTW